MLTPHREAKLQARRDLHEGLQDAAYLYLSGNTGKFKVVYVRSLTEWGALGDVKGTSLVYAERNDTRKSQIIFLIDQHIPERGDVVAIAHGGECWRVDNVEPVYNITVAANVTRLTAKEEILYKVPPAVAAYSEAIGYLPTAEIVTGDPQAFLPTMAAFVDTPAGFIGGADIEVDSG